jgi:hypothetical protein
MSGTGHVGDMHVMSDQSASMSKAGIAPKPLNVSRRANSEIGQ